MSGDKVKLPTFIVVFVSFLKISVILGVAFVFAIVLVCKVLAFAVDVVLGVVSVVGVSEGKIVLKDLVDTTGWEVGVDKEPEKSTFIGDCKYVFGIYE